MKYGFAIPTGGPMANARGIAALGAKGETLGFDLAHAVDHIALPKIMDLSNYPYSWEFLMATGRGRADAGGPGAPVGHTISGASGTTKTASTSRRPCAGRASRRRRIERCGASLGDRGVQRQRPVGKMWLSGFQDRFVHDLGVVRGRLQVIAVGFRIVREEKLGVVFLGQPLQPLHRFVRGDGIDVKARDRA